jgi:carboxyl-terminal processing protease
LTTARYFTPSGRSIQAKGITPDITVKPSRPEEEKEAIAPKMPAEKDLERHLEIDKGVPREKEKPKKEESKKEEPKKKEEVKEKKPVDQQLDRALELLKSWEIFKKLAKENK